MNPYDLNTVLGEGQDNADGPSRAVNLVVTEQFPDKTFPRRAKQERALELMEFGGVGQQQDVVLMGSCRSRSLGRGRCARAGRRLR